MKFQAYSDPGHGWVKVPMKLLHKLGIAEQITHSSYRRKEFAYLEEDCDMSLFVDTMNEAGIPIQFVETVCRFRLSKIRSYHSYYI